VNNPVPHSASLRGFKAQAGPAGQTTLVATEEKAAALRFRSNNLLEKVEVKDEYGSDSFSDDTMGELMASTTFESVVAIMHDRFDGDNLGKENAWTSKFSEPFPSPHTQRTMKVETTILFIGVYLVSCTATGAWKSKQDVAHTS
jgi:hypothetical protein